jgi:cation diffusion facilitator CzcD-associated flavoprotein CzcO
VSGAPVGFRCRFPISSSKQAGRRGAFMRQTVIILGGGIGGLSTAHELADRGFEVRVFESKPIFGGKARSIPVPNSAVDGRKLLPGEHGFRFFPGFYRHVHDTRDG